MLVLEIKRELTGASFDLILRKDACTDTDDFVSQDKIVATLGEVSPKFFKWDKKSSPSPRFAITSISSLEAMDKDTPMKLVGADVDEFWLNDVDFVCTC